MAKEVMQKQRFSMVLSISAIGTLLALPIWITPVHAESASGLLTPTASPSPGLDPAFLTLPAYDLELAPLPAPKTAPKAGKEDDARDAHRVRIGDQVVLKIQGLALKDIADPMKELKLEVPTGGESLNDQGWETGPFEGDVPAGEFWFAAIPLKPGRHTLPSLAIQNSAGTALARTNPLSIEVQSAIKSDDPKPEEPADIRPPVSLRFPWWVVALASLAALLLAGGVAYGIRRWVRRKPKVKAEAPAEPPRPEDEIAMAALAALEREGPLKRGEFKSHYFKVSEILKTYTGARYRFDATESTTREMINQLEQKRCLGDQQMDRLESIFEKLDLVKFTDHVPLPDEGLRLVELAREFVQTTRRGEAR